MMKKIGFILVLTITGTLLLDLDVKEAEVPVAKHITGKVEVLRVETRSYELPLDEVDEVVDVDKRIDELELSVYDSDSSTAEANEISKIILSIKESNGVEVDTLDKLSNAEKAYVNLKNMASEDFYQLSYQDKENLMLEFGGREVLSEYYYKHEILGENYDLPTPEEISQMRSFAQAKLIDDGDTTMMNSEGEGLYE